MNNKTIKKNEIKKKERGKKRSLAFGKMEEKLFFLAQFPLARRST
jgi:hypothetical protein